MGVVMAHTCCPSPLGEAFAPHLHGAAAQRLFPGSGLARAPNPALTRSCVRAPVRMAVQPRGRKEEMRGSRRGMLSQAVLSAAAVLAGTQWAGPLPAPAASAATDGAAAAAASASAAAAAEGQSGVYPP